MNKPANGEMTIRELAERTGMTVRNIRAHQTRGLLPPPVVRGRTGYYNEEHVARIALTREMQADGLNLEAIRRVLEGNNGSATEIFDFSRALRTSFEDEVPEIVDTAELADLWQEEIDEKREAKLIGRAEALGAMRPLPDGRFEMISPRMFHAAAALGELGVGPEAALTAAETLREQADGVARTFVDLFVKEIWVPFDRAGRPESDWAKVREALEKLRPLASDAVLGVFQLAMGDAVEKASERTLQLAAGEQPEQAADGAKSRRKRSRRS